MTEFPREAPLPFYAPWSLTPVWMLLCATALAGAWVQPNHYHPWSAFHSDAWMALFGLLFAGFVLAKSTRSQGLHGTVIAALAFALVVLLQRVAGLVESSGVAIMSILYMLGFALAMLIGAGSQSQPAIRDRVLDTFFLGVGLAGLVSVAIQLHQWLQLPLPAFWVMEGGSHRPYANLGQPNQLATLLVWSLLAVAWAVVRGFIGTAVASLITFVLTVGVALTQSRTGMIEIIAFLAALCAWRHLWQQHRRSIAAMAIVIGVSYFVAVAFQAMPPQLVLNGGITPATQGSSRALLDTSTANIRLAAYEMFIGAVWERPWAGYGWNQLSFAQLAVAEQFPAPHALFNHAHNVFLDIAAGMGLPIAIVSMAGVGMWTVLSVMRVKHATDAVLLLLVLTLGAHAMLELPLHYGYFLWPLGFVIGVLNIRLGQRAFLNAGTARAAAALWIVCAAAWGLTVRDYLLAEEEYRITRFEALNIGRTPTGPRPEMWILTQLGDLIWLARAKAAAGMTPDDLDRMRRVVTTYPALGGITKLAEALALNGHADEAAVWLHRLQKISSPLHIRAGELHWAARSASEPTIAEVEWPR